MARKSQVGSGVSDFLNSENASRRLRALPSDTIRWSHPDLPACEIEMADEFDLKALHDGDKDLARRDFRAADLTGLDLRGVDLSGAHLEQANIAGSDLSNCRLVQAQTLGMKAPGVKLVEAQVAGTVIFNVNFAGADLRSSTFMSSHITNSNLTGADLRGADFRDAVFNEGTTLEGCVVDENTLFDGASIFRPLARQEAFRFYRVDRGKLVRKPDDEIASNSQPPTRDGASSNPEMAVAAPVGITDSADATVIRGDDRSKVVAAVDAALLSLAKIPFGEDGEQPVAGIGHNNPPQEIPISREEYRELVSALQGVRAEVQKDVPVEKSLTEASSSLARVVPKVCAWAGHKLDVAAEEFAKSAGKSLGGAPFVVAAWLTAIGEVGHVLDILGAFIGRLFH
jgi:uncharacterized protein YjbI with pentapeptide repeats